MAGFGQFGTGWDIDEKVQKVALLEWDTETLSWVRKVSVDASAKQTLFDQASSTVLYIGKSAPGTSISDPAWSISRTVFDGSGFPVSITQASNGSATAQWDQRASLSYS